MNWKIKAPQIIWLALAIFVFAATIVLNGQTYLHKYNWIQELGSLMVSGGLLLWGGFFTYEKSGYKDFYPDGDNWVDGE